MGVDETGTDALGVDAIGVDVLGVDVMAPIFIRSTWHANHRICPQTMETIENVPGSNTFHTGLIYFYAK